MEMTTLPVTLFAIALLMHGIGHSMGILQSWGIAKMTPDSSTGGFLTRLGLVDVQIKTVGLLFGVVIVGYLAALFGFWQGLEWWRPLTIAMSATSLGLFTIWWSTLPLFSDIGATAFNIVSIIAALFWHL